jgi:hypothetical protein
MLHQHLHWHAYEGVISCYVTPTPAYEGVMSCYVTPTPAPARL